MTDDSNENVPLLRDDDPTSGVYQGGVGYGADGDRDAEEQHGTIIGREEEFVEPTNRNRGNGGASVQCRVCDSALDMDGKSNQHVIKCNHCGEATPIRGAPPGKKYVRCPCNCLLICKASSTRIACPRANCRRVITLGSRPVHEGSAIRAPTGTCRVNCAYCGDVFMFNTLTNQLANCPHCKKQSSVGQAFKRQRALLFGLALMVALVTAVLVVILVPHTIFMIPVYIIAFLICAYLTAKVYFYASVRVSTILGPL